MNQARAIALSVFRETVHHGGYPNLLLKDAGEQLDDRDRRFVTLLVQETLTWLIHIDYILSLFLTGKRTKPVIKDILRMGVCQLVFLKMSPPAVIHESVELTKQIGKGMLGGFVNGVLRNVDRAEAFPYPKEGTLAYTSIMTSKPEWLIALWTKEYGKEAAACYAAPRTLPTYVRWNNHRYPDFDVPNWLKEHGYAFTPCEPYANLFALSSSTQLVHTDAFQDGRISIQGSGSLTACEALGVEKGDCVLDACAAPGGKSLYLAEQLAGTGSLTACDLHANRLNLVQENLKRGGYTAKEYLQRDMTVFDPKLENQFDRVLADTPCSGLGVLNQKPDILLRQTLDTVAALADTQKRILDCVCRYVKPGGTLVYSTCTLNQIENNGVVQSFLKEHPDFSLHPFTYGSGQRVQRGMLQLTPDQWEGFFIARFQRI